MRLGKPDIDYIAVCGGVGRNFPDPHSLRKTELSIAVVELIAKMWLSWEEKQPFDDIDLEQHITRLVQTIDTHARMDELERIRAVTLDADSDVWVKNDDQQIVSLTARLEQLRREC
jgi:hypothetical protein